MDWLNGRGAFLPEYKWVIHIFMLGAEAGVVGGLADWYAVTVLFPQSFWKNAFTQTIA